MILEEIISSDKFIQWTLKTGYNIGMMIPTGFWIERNIGKGKESLELREEVKFDDFLNALNQSVLEGNDQIAAFLIKQRKRHKDQDGLVL